MNYDKYLKKLKLYPPEKKSTFGYWGSHWLAFQLVALKLGVWKFRHLFHDIEKPFLKLFLPYEKVRHFHRKYHRHHRGYRKPDKIHWLDLVIDWEASQFTKMDQKMNAWQYSLYIIKTEPKNKKIVEEKILPLITELQLIK